MPRELGHDAARVHSGCAHAAITTAIELDCEEDVRSF
jgi:hypothetical protein